MKKKKKHEKSKEWEREVNLWRKKEKTKDEIKKNEAKQKLDCK